MKKALTNPDIATIAVLILGGDKKHIDLEDVAIKADEIAPYRFLWKKYKKYIDKDVVRCALSDAKKPAKGNYVTGSDAKGWMLTQKGVDFAKNHLLLIKKYNLSRPRIAKQEREWLSREYLRLILVFPLYPFGYFTLSSTSKGREASPRSATRHSSGKNIGISASNCQILK